MEPTTRHIRQWLNHYDKGSSRKENWKLCSGYSPFHSSLPFEHLGRSNLHSSLPFVCKSGNFLFYFRTETVCQVFLKSIQHLSLGNDVTSSDKNIIIARLKHIFISKFFAQHIQCILRTHNCNKQNFINLSSYLIGIYMAKVPHRKLKISLEFAIFKGNLV